MPSGLTELRTAEATITVSRGAALKIAGFIISEFLRHPRSKMLAFTIESEA